MVEIWSIIAIRWLRNIPIMYQNIDKGFPAWYTNNVPAQRKSQKKQNSLNFAKSKFFYYYTPYKINTNVHLLLLYTGTPYSDKY